MENKEIIRALRKTASYMEILGENSFKVRALNNAIFNLERLEKKLSEFSLEEIMAIDGVGKSIAQQIHELLTSGVSSELERLTSAIPPGVIELQGIGGLGAKKIRLIWQEHGIDSPDALSQAIESGHLSEIKGFGAKTIKQISEALSFRQENTSKLLYPEAKQVSDQISEFLNSKGIRYEESGQLRREEPIIDELVFLVERSGILPEELDTSPDFREDKTASSPFNWRGTFKEEQIPIRFRYADIDRWGAEQVKQTGPPDFVYSNQLINVAIAHRCHSEKEAFEIAAVPFIPPALRGVDIDKDKTLISSGDIRGILHAHSTYSDGQNSLSEMIDACIERGYEYFGITDHSRSSYFYANGLFENRVMDQFKEIEKLRAEYPKFKIFRGIECDILSDGSLDYADDILSQFDFIVASIHSVLQMDMENATKRMLRAIENPYTTMLGHLTGRLLLRRKGYPLNMNMILDACAANGVSIELNANPRRLDVDYHFLPQVLERGIKISINPDAHSITGLDDVKYGIQMARKGGITAEDNLTSYSACKRAEFFEKRLQKRTS